MSSYSFPSGYGCLTISKVKLKMSDNPTPSTEKGSISVGDLSNNAGVAIGENAHAEVHYHYTYIERPSPHIPYLAPSLPPHHVPRQSVLGQLVQMLCDGSHDRIAVRGMGGLGKTTTAIALCHDKKVLECFTDGILWATLGPNPHVMVAQAAWAEELGVEFSTLTDAEARAIRLRSLLYDKCCLLVLDDTWD